MIYRDTSAIEAVNTGRDVPDAFYLRSTLIATSKWHSTDGWRGYNKVTPQPGYKLLDSDWITGDWDDAGDNAESKQEARFAELEREHGDIIIIYTPTSNVSSTGIDILIRDADVKPLKGKTIAHKTKRYELPNGGWRVQYHATDVVTYNPDKQPHYTLDTGGLATMTTAKRMTDALPGGYYVCRRNWIMYVNIPGTGLVELKDGMEV